MKSKATLLGQQTVQWSFTSNSILGFSTPERSRSSTNASKEGSSVADKIKQTSTLLNIFGFKNFTTKKNYDSISESSPHASRNMSLLKINLCDSLCYSSTSIMIMQTIVTDASSMEEQFANLAKLVECNIPESRNLEMGGSGRSPALH